MAKIFTCRISDGESILIQDRDWYRDCTHGFRNCDCSGGQGSTNFINHITHTYWGGARHLPLTHRLWCRGLVMNSFLPGCGIKLSCLYTLHKQGFQGHKFVLNWGLKLSFHHIMGLQLALVDRLTGPLRHFYGPLASTHHSFLLSFFVWIFLQFFTIPWIWWICTVFPTWLGMLCTTPTADLLCHGNFSSKSHIRYTTQPVHCLGPPALPDHRYIGFSRAVRSALYLYRHMFLDLAIHITTHLLDVKSVFINI